ncbi:MAG TPA: hypothetical protein VF655_00275 [Allosphingosinicella sp.]|jgi:hypothetical protein
MARVHPLLGAAVVFIAAPLAAGVISSLIVSIAGAIFGFNSVAVAFWGGLAITPLLWLWFMGWNLRD